jgi:hypothetical protein
MPSGPHVPLAPGGNLGRVLDFSGEYDYTVASLPTLGRSAGPHGTFIAVRSQRRNEIKSKWLTVP